ncbi:MAG: nicotinate phosphoribosyltransferase, partial [Cetobacterium sp.]
VIKISNPGFKEVYRIYDEEGFAYADLITLVENDIDKEKLLNEENILIRDEKYEFKTSLLVTGKYSYRKITNEFVKNGVIKEEALTLQDVIGSKQYYLDSLAKVSDERKRLENPHQYKVDLSKDLLELKYNLIKEIKSQIV